MRELLIMLGLFGLAVWFITKAIDMGICWH